MAPGDRGRDSWPARLSAAPKRCQFNRARRVLLKGHKSGQHNEQGTTTTDLMRSFMLWGQWEQGSPPSSGPTPDRPAGRCPGPTNNSRDV